MKMNDDAIAPLILMILIGLFLVFILLGGWILIALTTKTLITVILVGLGAYLFIRPSGLEGNMRTYVPFGLIILGILFYVGVFSKIVG